jgi:hypothetical protein
MPADELAAARYRRLAHQCLELARTITNQQARAALIEMAQVWQRLAEQQEDKKTRSTALGRRRTRHRAGTDDFRRAKISALQ